MFGNQNGVILPKAPISIPRGNTVSMRCVILFRVKPYLKKKGVLSGFAAYQETNIRIQRQRMAEPYILIRPLILVR